MPRIGYLLAVGALGALPLLTAAPALAKHHHRSHATSGQTAKIPSVAYPRAPGGMPAASDKGKPIQPAADPSAKPGPSTEASPNGAPNRMAAPTAPYPGAPGGTPAAGDKGRPIK